MAIARYWEGSDLLDYLMDKGPIEEQRAKKLFKRVVESVKYLHEQKICHRDIKAENFILRRSGEEDLGLLDCGMAYEWHENMNAEMKQNG